MRKVTILWLITALSFTSCMFFQKKTAVLWTDKPEFAMYAEQFNLSQNQYKIETRYMESPAQGLLSASEYPDIVVGNWLKSSATRTFFASLEGLFSNGRVREDAFYPALLSLGRVDKTQFLFPVSYNLPVIIFSRENEELVSHSQTISPGEIQEKGKLFNTQRNGVFSRMGFCPTANDDFIFLMSTLFNTAFREGTPLAWDPIALEKSVDYIQTWITGANISVQAESDFVFKYFYDPPPKLTISGRILFGYMPSSDFFTLGEETRSQLEFRWVAENNVIPVDERIVYMGICKKGKAREAAKAFVEWFYQDETQRNLLSVSRQTRISDNLFGIANGFSALIPVTESIFPLFYPNLLGHIPPEDSLSPPNILPRNWMTLKENVILPYLHERVRSENKTEVKTLEKRISDWYRQNPVR